MNMEASIQKEDYVRQRMSPEIGDSDYLHLSDLQILMKNLQTDEQLRLLDYGCGGSPYRGFFPSADYRRADFEAMESLDYIIEHDSRIAEQDESFDLILSTQVAEHVSNPMVYLAECFRLLKKGGRLICTTHGIYPDHGCPYDFQRWTADGLIRDVKAAGFSVDKTFKLTTNGRAMMYLLQRFSGWFDGSASKIWSPALRVYRIFQHRKPKYWQKLSDRLFARNRVVEAGVEGHEFYIGVAVIAVKQ